MQSLWIVLIGWSLWFLCHSWHAAAVSPVIVSISRMDPSPFKLLWVITLTMYNCKWQLYLLLVSVFPSLSYVGMYAGHKGSGCNIIGNVLHKTNWRQWIPFIAMKKVVILLGMWIFYLTSNSLVLYGFYLYVERWLCINYLACESYVLFVSILENLNQI